jgi:hypothetical protein
MNRRDRRALEVTMRASLRAAGCNCTPDVSPTPRHPTFGAGLVVKHVAPCRFGAQFIEANRAGRLPIVFAPGLSVECDR